MLLRVRIVALRPLADQAEPALHDLQPTGRSISLVDRSASSWASAAFFRYSSSRVMHKNACRVNLVREPKLAGRARTFESFYTPVEFP
jgi:hypothetical protein